MLGIVWKLRWWCSAHTTGQLRLTHSGCMAWCPPAPLPGEKAPCEPTWIMSRGIRLLRRRKWHKGPLIVRDLVLPFFWSGVYPQQASKQFPMSTSWRQLLLKHNKRKCLRNAHLQLIAAVGAEVDHRMKVPIVYHVRLESWDAQVKLASVALNKLHMRLNPFLRVPVPVAAVQNRDAVTRVGLHCCDCLRS